MGLEDDARRAAAERARERADKQKAAEAAQTARLRAEKDRRVSLAETAVGEWAERLGITVSDFEVTEYKPAERIGTDEDNYSYTNPFIAAVFHAENLQFNAYCRFDYGNVPVRTRVAYRGRTIESLADLGDASDAQAEMLKAPYTI